MFQAKRWARSRHGPDKGHNVLIYDIVLEENVLGIPVSALPIIIGAVGAVAVSESSALIYPIEAKYLINLVLLQLCVAILPWWAGAGAPFIVRWIVTGTGKVVARQRKAKARR